MKQDEFRLLHGEDGVSLVAAGKERDVAIL